MHSVVQYEDYLHGICIALSILSGRDAESLKRMHTILRKGVGDPQTEVFMNQSCIGRKETLDLESIEINGYYVANYFLNSADERVKILGSETSRERSDTAGCSL